MPLSLCYQLQPVPTSSSFLAHSSFNEPPSPDRTFVLLLLSDGIPSPSEFNTLEKKEKKKIPPSFKEVPSIHHARSPLIASKTLCFSFLSSLLPCLCKGIYNALKKTTFPA